MNRPHRRLLLVALAAGPGAFAWPARAQSDYPSRPIRIVVPFPPGGATDVVARLVGDKLSRSLGQPVLVENRAGAGGQLGTEQVARATPDGYTLLVTNTGLVQNALLSAKPSYDPVRDFRPVAQINLAPAVFSINPDLPAKSLPAFIALVKREPGKHSFGSAGVAQTLHLFGEMLNRSAALDMAHVPFQGEALEVNAIMAGHVSGGFATVASSRAAIQAGKLRALAMTGPNRSPLLPDVPSFRELGFAGFDPIGWYGMLAPAGTPPAIVEKLALEVGNALKMPDVSARLNDLALTPTGTTPEEFGRIIRSTLADWSRIMKEANITPN
jgi:tripartite-type tricarboxylate transporter receptor subunit TctC